MTKARAIGCLLLAAAICNLTAGAAIAADLPAASEAKNQSAKPEPAPVHIEVLGEWGGAPRENVQRLLDSTAGCLLANCPERHMGVILVRRHENTPITLYQKGPASEHQVFLNAQGNHWCQYSYQFSHELAHVLCNYDRRKEGPNLWFEEALCETASLFTLRKMSSEWKTKPPYPNWTGFAPHLKEYVDALLAGPDRRLPPDRTMAHWYREHAAALASHRSLKPESMLVAAYLLPIFEEEPTGWQVLDSLAGDSGDGKPDFPAMLGRWKERARPPQKPFIGKIQRLFGVE